MLNKVLVLLSEIIYNAWQKVISDLATPPPPLPGSSTELGYGDTHRFVFSQRYRVFATSVLGTQSLKKKIKDTKMFLGILRFYLCKKIYVYAKIRICVCARV